MEIGMRKGRRRAIHIPVVVKGEKHKGATAKGFYGSKEFAKIERGAELEDGASWLVIVPSAGKGKSMRLDELTIDGRVLKAKFTGGSFRHIDVIMDNRGRALNLEIGEDYMVNITPWKRFFELYERRSIPVGKGRRSEPEEAGGTRIKNIHEMANSCRGRGLDAATGIKDYLPVVADKCSLTCGNISPSMLQRTRAWLGGKASFVAYDAETGFPFKKGCFDFAICDAMLEYIHEPRVVLNEMARIINKGGAILLLEPIKATREVEEFYPQDLWEVALWRPLNDREFNARALEKILQYQGFKEVERRSMSFEYPIYGGEQFQQDIVRFEKLYI